MLSNFRSAFVHCVVSTLHLSRTYDNEVIYYCTPVIAISQLKVDCPFGISFPCIGEGTCFVRDVLIQKEQYKHIVHRGNQLF